MTRITIPYHVHYAKKIFTVTAVNLTAVRDVLLETKGRLAIKATVPAILTVRTNFGAIDVTNSVERVVVETNVTEIRAIV